MQKSAVDRILGSFVGFSKGFLIMITLFLLGDEYIMSQFWWKDSYLSEDIYYYAELVGSLVGQVPLEEIKDIQLDEKLLK